MTPTQKNALIGIGTFIGGVFVSSMIFVLSKKTDKEKLSILKKERGGAVVFNLVFPGGLHSVPVLMNSSGTTSYMFVGATTNFMGLVDKAQASLFEENSIWALSKDNDYLIPSSDPTLKVFITGFIPKDEILATPDPQKNIPFKSTESSDAPVSQKLQEDLVLTQ